MARSFAFDMGAIPAGDGGMVRQRLDVALVPAETRAWTSDCVVILVDVLRATSTIVTMFMSGAEVVLPVAGLTEARRFARSAGYVLVGERGGRRPRGFDFDNSPTDLTRADLAARTCVLTSTNGVRTLHRLRAARVLILGSFLNASAVSRTALAMAQGTANIGIVCSGLRGGVVLDDAACAGHIVETILALDVKSEGAWQLGDGSLAARAIASTYPDPSAALWSSASGHLLSDLGKAADVDFCAQEDVTALVPVLGTDTGGIPALRVWVDPSRDLLRATPIVDMP